MMNSPEMVLVGTALLTGFLHALFSPDHSLFFVIHGRSEGQSLKKALGLAALFNSGHILTGALLGGLMIFSGMALETFHGFQHLQEWLIGYLLIGFGLSYAFYWFLKTRTFKRNQFFHHHQEDGTLHNHSHKDCLRGQHPLGENQASPGLWGLLILFTLKPCEALVPVLMIPAYQLNPVLPLLVVFFYWFGTLTSVSLWVSLGYMGCSGLSEKGSSLSNNLLDYGKTLTGLSVAFSGIVLKFFHG